MELGFLVKHESLRDVWEAERRFSTWLSKEENLKVLGDEIGINMVSLERESPVGEFSLDIFAYEESTKRKIIIENQLEETNHDHLGKIITYAAGKDAEVIIWIVKKAREEHRKAIDWLNEHTDDKIGFFLIELELWKIGKSLPAPKFMVVAQPNDWAKTMKSEGLLSDTQKLQYNFWRALVDYGENTDFKHQFLPRKAHPQNWFDLGIGMSGAYIMLTVNTLSERISAEIYIPDDSDLFQLFFRNKEKIEDELGFTMEWRPSSKGKVSRIITTTQGDVKQEAEWAAYFKWYIEKATKLREVFHKYR